MEIDGSQHKLDKKIEDSDIRRDDFMKNNDWKVIRIEWIKYQKLNKEEKENYIIEVINYIKEQKIKPSIIEKKNLCPICGGIKKEKRSLNCDKCNKIKIRKVPDRPSLNVLLDDIKQFGYEGTGRNYNVSSSSIRKWLKYYNYIKKN